LILFATWPAAIFASLLALLARTFAVDPISTARQPVLVKPGFAPAPVYADAEPAHLVIEEDLPVGIIRREHQLFDFVVREVHGAPHR
jgi:hypothetical protein